MIEIKEKIEFDIRSLPFPYPVSDDEYIDRAQIYRDYRLKCYVNSNENTSHNRPHVHIIFDSNDYEVTIDDKIEVIKPNKCRTQIKRLLICDVIINLKLCREKWNQIKSNYKFNDQQLDSLKAEYKNGIGVVTYK